MVKNYLPSIPIVIPGRIKLNYLRCKSNIQDRWKKTISRQFILIIINGRTKLSLKN